MSDVTQETYDVLTNMFSDRGRFQLANYLAHNLEIVGVTGVILDRFDHEMQGNYVVAYWNGTVKKVGRDSFKIKSEQIAVDKQHYHDLRKEVRELKKELERLKND